MGADSIAPDTELVELAAAALTEVADPATVGPLVDVSELEPGVLEMAFECLLPGYPGWRWTVATARLPGAVPTVLEVELLPADGALLAPPWTPWAERLAEYRRTHDAGAGDGSDDEGESDDEKVGDDVETDDEDGDADLDEADDDDEDEDDDLDDDDDDDLDEDDDDEDDDLDDDDLDEDDEADDDLDDGIDVEAAAGLDETPDDDAWHGEGH